MISHISEYYNTKNYNMALEKELLLWAGVANQLVYIFSFECLNFFENRITSSQG